MRTYEERTQYILEERDRRLEKRRRTRATIAAVSAVSICSLALIAGIGIITTRASGGRGVVWMSPNAAGSSGASASGSTSNEDATSTVGELPVEEIKIDNPNSAKEFTMTEFPDVVFSIGNGTITANGETLFGGHMPADLYLADLNGDGKRELCTDWGVLAPSTAMDRGICALDYTSGKYYVLSDPDNIAEYSISIKDKKLSYTYLLISDDGKVQGKAELSLSDMKLVSDDYFVNRGEDLTVEKIYDVADYRPLYQSPPDFKFTIPEFPYTNLEITDNTLYANGRRIYPVLTVYLADLNGDGYREICMDSSFGSGIVDRRIAVYDYANDELYELSGRMNYDYVLSITDGVLMYQRYDYPLERYEDSHIDGVLKLSDMEKIPLISDREE